MAWMPCQRLLKSALRIGLCRTHAPSQPLADVGGLPVLPGGLTKSQMPGQVGILEPLSWINADYEHQIALKAHLDSLSVELSLLRSDVVDVLHRRSLRRRRADIFRAWHFHIALGRPSAPNETRRGGATIDSPREAQRGRQLRSLNTLRCATILCVFLSSSLLQLVLSHWRLAVHRQQKPLDLRAFPAWRLQLFLWAWRGAVETPRGSSMRMSMRHRAWQHSPRNIGLQSQVLQNRAASALRTLRDYDLAYFILQAWNGAVVSATLAQLGGAPTQVVFQPNPHTHPAGPGYRLRRPDLDRARSPLVARTFRRTAITMMDVMRAWYDTCASSRQSRQHIRNAALRVAREILRLVWHVWHEGAKAQKAQRFLVWSLEKKQMLSLRMVSKQSNMQKLRLFLQSWMAFCTENQLRKLKSRRDHQLRQVGPVLQVGPPPKFFLHSTTYTHSVNISMPIKKRLFWEFGNPVQERAFGTPFKNR